jgi:hypothetical protein
MLLKTMTLVPGSVANEIDEIITPDEAKRRLETCEMGIHLHPTLVRIAEGNGPASLLKTYQQVVAEESKRFGKSTEGG